MPPLRERSDDIPDLADSDPAAAGTPHEARSRRSSRAEAVERPARPIPFPGNVRELENVLERALTLCTGGVIDARAHQAAQRHRAPQADAAGSGTCGRTRPAAALGDQLEDIERDAIIKALEKTRYNKTAAAKLLG